ncbi:MAG: helicase-associated domain-containing protein [Treponema sp.]|jgi:hypothetical protein|nr:helicase-associated domain-containing protein [Treponema sp.]
MINPPFGSLADWKSALMTLPDASFFELVRSVFGNIKTPFSKHRLLEDLVAFFAKEEIRRAIADYIDERDALIIAAVAVLSGPLPGELESFFAGELSLAAFQEALVNLEERFIIYRLREGDRRRLALNPALEPVLTPFIAGDALFPSLPAEGPPPPLARDDRLLGALVSFTLEELHFFRSEGKFRKRVLDLGAAVFPGLDLERGFGGFAALGLLRAEGEDLIPGGEMLAAFGGISPRERLEYWAAGIRVYEDPEAPRGNFFRGSVCLCRASVRKTFRLIHRFFNLLEKERRYPLSTLLRYWSILVREERSRPRFEELRDIFEMTGLLCPAAGETWMTGPVFGKAGTASLETGPAFPKAGPEGGACLVMDTSASWFLYPGIPFADVLDLAFFSVIRETGTAVRMELTRESAVRGFDHGYTAEGMIGTLRRLSGGRINETLAWTLGDWEKRYGEVALYQGVVLSLEESRRYLADAEPVRSLIQRVLAPGVYLLDSSGTEEAAEALRQAGVGIVARHDTVRPAGVLSAGQGDAPRPAGGRGNFFPPADAVFSGGEPWGAGIFAGRGDAPPEDGPPSGGPESSPKAAGAVRRERREERMKRLRDRLTAMPLDRAERDELSARIKRRLVLSESQLEGASVRYEKREARLLDYVGKAAIAKQAIASKSLLEVHWPHPEKGLVETTGVPRALEKSGGESILVIGPGGDPAPDTGTAAESPAGNAGPVSRDAPRISGECLRIPLGKISLMRRIKKSIFGD